MHGSNAAKPSRISKRLVIFFLKTHSIWGSDALKITLSNDIFVYCE